MQYLQRSTKQEVLQLQRNWQSYFTLCGEKKPSLKNSRMQQLPTSSKGKGILKSVTIIEASLYCQLLGRFVLGSYWTDWMNTWNSQGFYQKASVDLGNRGTIDMIFTARQLQQKCQEQNVDLYMTFVDLTKAFDTVSREGLWKIMAKFGCPAKFIAMVRQFHDGMLARVQNDGEFSDPFPVTNGVKQGCVLDSTLFSMMFSAMLTDAFQNGDNGIPIRYCFDGKLSNLRRLQAQSKVQTEVLDEFLFADDMAGCSNRRKNAKMCGSSIWFLWQLWSHNQHQKYWGSISASTWKALQGAYQSSIYSLL